MQRVDALEQAVGQPVLRHPEHITCLQGAQRTFDLPYLGTIRRDCAETQSRAGQACIAGYEIDRRFHGHDAADCRLRRGGRQTEHDIALDGDREGRFAVADFRTARIEQARVDPIDPGLNCRAVELHGIRP